MRDDFKDSFDQLFAARVDEMLAERVRVAGHRRALELSEINEVH